MVQKLKISQLVNNTGQIEGVPANPRTIDKLDYQKLLKSLQDDPEYLEHEMPHVIAHGDKYVVLNGNQRLRALRELKFIETPVTIYKPDTPPEVIRARIIKSNHGYGKDDFDMLANDVWSDDPLCEWGMDLPDDWLQDEQEVVEDEAPEVDESEPPKSKLGEIYQLGRHRVMCADSTVKENVELLMDGNKADMVFTDPPYNVDYVGKTKEALKIQNDKSSLFEFRSLISDFIDVMLEYTKRGSSYYVCMPLEVGVTDLFLEKSHLQSVIIWLKNTIVMGRKDYQQKTEPILYLTDEEYSTEEASYQGVIYGWKFGDRHEWYGGRKQSNVWEFDKPQRNGDHPTTKPIGLVAKAISNSSKTGDIVLDLFLGSGSTLIACEQTGRTCFGMELSEAYTDVVRKRWAKYVYGDGALENDKWIELTPVVA